MQQQEKQMIDELFGKLKQAEAQTGAREASAESYIRDAVAAQPGAPYYMAQAILVQEHALNNLNQRVQELEQELTKRPAGGGGFLGGLFGAGNSNTAAAGRSPATAANPGPFQNARQGSFLGGAMQTAMGVAGGMLLANAMVGMFAGDTAEAATAATDETPPEQPAAETEDSGGWGDVGMDDDF
jgi:hypothetical protein